MKKLLVLFLLLYTFNVNAANLTDTIGAECGSILLKSEETKIEKLEKCLKMYKEVGGDYDQLNKKFYRSKVLFDIDMYNISEYSSANNKKDIDALIEITFLDFFNNMMLSSFELYNKHKNTYEAFKDTEKDTSAYKRSEIKYNITKDWYESDLELIQNIISQQEENKTPPKKGIFGWFK